MKKYLKIWWILTTASAQNSFTSRVGAIILICGKILRFGLFFFFLYVVATKTKLIAGYTLSQIIIFFLSYQLIDLLPQFFLREVYRFRQYIITGDFDYFLVKPFSPLFRGLFGGTDPLDTPLIFLTILFLILAIGPSIHGNIINIFLYVFYLLNALVIALAFHIGILALGIVTTEIDSAMLLYRDLTMMGRIPVSIYKQPLQGFLTFIVPVAVMMSVPAQVLFGFADPLMMIFAIALSSLLLYLSIQFWRYALAQYASASS